MALALPIILLVSLLNALESFDVRCGRASVLCFAVHTDNWSHFLDFVGNLGLSKLGGLSKLTEEGWLFSADNGQTQRRFPVSQSSSTTKTCSIFAWSKCPHSKAP